MVWSARTVKSSVLGPPFQSIARATGQRMSQPCALAIVNGRQRYGGRSGKSSIHWREARAGTIFGGSLLSAKQCNFIRSEPNRQYVTGSLDYQRFRVLENNKKKNKLF